MSICLMFVSFFKKAVSFLEIKSHKTFTHILICIIGSILRNHVISRSFYRHFTAPKSKSPCQIGQNLIQPWPLWKVLENAGDDPKHYFKWVNMTWNTSTYSSQWNGQNWTFWSFLTSQDIYVTHLSNSSIVALFSVSSFRHGSHISNSLQWRQ